MDIIPLLPNDYYLHLEILRNLPSPYKELAERTNMTSSWNEYENIIWETVEKERTLPYLSYEFLII